MSQQCNLSAIVNNDLLFEFTLNYGSGPVDLDDGYTVTIVLKASQTAADDTGTTYTTSNGITVTYPDAGKLTWAVQAADNAAAGTFWYRLDLTLDGDVATAMMGTLTVAAA